MSGAGLVVVTRHRVAAGGGRDFLAGARSALAVLARRTGFVDGVVARALDEADLWVLTTRWRDVGSYRRALTSVESKMLVVPLLSSAIDEPSAFEVLYASPDEDAAGRVGWSSALAADAGSTRLGEAAAPLVPTDLDRPPDPG